MNQEMETADSNMSQLLSFLEGYDKGTVAMSSVALD